MDLLGTASGNPAVYPEWYIAGFTTIKEHHFSMKSHDPSLTVSSDSPVESSGLDVFNKAALLDRVGGQADLLPRLLSMFFSTVEDVLARLERSVADEDALEARKLSHALKGVAANVGAERMCAVIMKLEAFARREELAEFVMEMQHLRAEYELFKSVAHE